MCYKIRQGVGREIKWKQSFSISQTENVEFEQGPVSEMKKRTVSSLRAAGPEL